MVGESPELRRYSGSGTLEFISGERLDCEFSLSLLRNGRISLKCVAPISKDFVSIAKKEADHNYTDVARARFIGISSDGGHIVIERLTLDVTNISGKQNETEGNGKYLVDLNTIDQEIRTFLEGMPSMLGLRNTSMSGKWLFQANLTLLAMSSAKITYASLDQDAAVTSIWGITNLEFNGCNPSVSGRTHRDNFSFSVGSYEMAVTHVDDYDSIIETLKKTEGVDVTSEISVVAHLAQMPDIVSKMEDVCTLLSFATLNWVTWLYNDVLKEGKLVQTTLSPAKTFSFRKADEVINTKDGCGTGNFVETAYRHYEALTADFNLALVIEYYLSAVRQTNSEAKFIVGFVAVECLASFVSSYSKKLGESIPTNSVAATRRKIESINKRKNLRLSESVIDELADELAYKEIGIKDRIRYLSRKFDVKMDDKVFGNAVSFRGKLMHTGMDPDKDSHDRVRDIFDIIERTLLTMLGWKGRPYIDKKSGYKYAKLD